MPFDYDDMAFAFKTVCVLEVDTQRSREKIKLSRAVARTTFYQVNRGINKFVKGQNSVSDERKRQNKRVVSRKNHRLG